MKGTLVVANPTNEDHIKQIEEYERQNNLENTISQYFKKDRTLLTEMDSNQQQQETPEITKILFLVSNGTIVALSCLIGETDRKACQITIYPSSMKWQEKMLEETENYAFFTLKMEELALFQEEKTQIPDTYLSNHGFEGLGVVSGRQVYIKSRSLEERKAYQM